MLDGWELGVPGSCGWWAAWCVGESYIMCASNFSSLAGKLEGDLRKIAGCEYWESGFIIMCVG